MSSSLAYGLLPVRLLVVLLGLMVRAAGLLFVFHRFFLGDDDCG